MRLSASALLFPILFLACSSETVWVDDFIPPSEVERGYENDGPFEQRMLTATSADGVNWEKTNIILTEQGNTPDMAIKEEVIYLYYTGGNFDGNKQAIAVALSKDDGTSWTFKRVTIEGYTSNATPGDPDVILLEDGTFRLYFTAQLDGDQNPSILFAEGTDGMNFTYKGKAFSAEGYLAIDSSAFIVNEQWMMLTFSGFGTEMIHAQSQDEGQTFEFVKAEPVNLDKDPYFMANPLPLEDGSVRFYGFNLKDGIFASFLSNNGLAWEVENETLLQYDKTNPLEGFYIKDPAVVQLEDGTYLMVYVTRAPLE